MTGMRPSTRRRIAFLGAFTLYFVALWALWTTPFVYPLKVFVVLLHEISHGLAAVTTGGRIDRIVLSMAEGGACYCPGGSAFVTLSAGYLGSLGWGLLLMTGARLRPKRLPVLVGAVGAAVLGITALWVRSAFGVLFGLLFGAALLLAARHLRSGGQAGLLTALGLTSALYAVLDIRSDVLQRPHLESDARMLAELTGVPTVAWGVLWIGVALLVCGLAFRHAWRTA